MDSSPAMGDDTRRFLELHFPEEDLARWKGLAYHIAGPKAGQVDPSGVVKDAAIHAARHHRELKEAGNFEGWFKTTLAREVMARLKLARHRRTYELGDAPARQLRDPREQVSPLEREEEKAWAKAYLWQLLTQLSEADQEVICLSRLKGLPDAEVARMLQITEENLRKRRSRAMQRLRELARQTPTVE